MPLWTLLLTLAIGILRIHISSGSGIIEARCKINCLSTVQMHNTSISNCESNLNCSSCLIPCSFEYKTRRLCEAKCQSASDISRCLESCNYLKLITHQHNGRCPPQEAISGFQKACVDACSDDAGCKSGQKCCSNGCGHTCQQAVIQSDDYPPRPVREHISVEENDDASSVTIGWLPRKPPDPGEILAYAVQGRNHSGENLKKKLMGAWRTIDVTQFLKANIELSVGRFYQFRVASVNINGSRGYSRMTPAFKLSRNPSQPSPPRNLKKVRSILRPDGMVNVVISWDPPGPSDLELQRFRIFWSERPETIPVLMRLQEFKKTVIVPTTSCELIGLRQGTKYFIQVQSVARWGNIRKCSQRIGTLIRVENFNEGGSADGIDIPNFLPHSGDSPGPVEEIHHSRTYWHNNNLKNNITWQKPLGYESRVGRFTIHWKPIQCFNRQDQETHEASVRQDTSFTIYNLTFDCMYLVWVVPVSTDELLGQAAYISFTTPPCSEVMALNTEKPVCPTAAPDLPSAPVNVSHMFIIQEGGNIAVNISWGPPLHHSDRLTGYRIVWMEYKPHPPNFYRQGFPVLDLSYTRTVSQDVNYIILDSVDAGMRYFVTVSATNTIGGGDLAVLDIKTPIVTMPMHPIPPTVPESNIRKTETEENHSLTTDPNPTHRSSGRVPLMNVMLLCISTVLWCTLHFRWR